MSYIKNDIFNPKFFIILKMEKLINIIKLSEELDPNDSNAKVKILIKFLNQLNKNPNLLENIDFKKKIKYLFVNNFSLDVVKIKVPYLLYKQYETAYETFTVLNC